MKELESLFAAVDQAFEQVAGEYAEEVRCGKGCADCCHAAFDVSLVEAVNLWRQVGSMPETVQEVMRKAARDALCVWDTLLSEKGDLSRARIRCPLLNAAGQCLCYRARPVNCRTYGIPTVIAGKAHVCGLAGFEQGKTYPVVHLEAIQRILYDLSVQMGGSDVGQRRWSVAAIVHGEPLVAGLAEHLETKG